MRLSNIIPSFVWLIIAIIICAVTVDSSSYVVHSLLVVAIIYSYFRCLRIWKSKGNSLLSLYSFFILYMCASNLGQSIVSLLPNTLYDLPIYEQFSLQDIISALRFQLLCVAAMGLGTAFYLDTHRCNYSTQLMRDNYIQKDKMKFSDSFIFKVVFFIAILLVFLDAFSYLLMRQTMGYMDAYTARQQGGIPLYMHFINWLMTLLAFYFAYSKTYPKLIITLFSILVFIFMACGNRSLTIKYLAFLMLLCPVVYPQYFKRKYWFVWAILLVCFLTSLSLISAARNDIGFAMQVGSRNGSFVEMLLLSFSEMGGSAQTLIYTMQAIGEGFQHHLTEAYFMITALSTSKLCNLLGLGNEYLPLGEWVTEYAGIRSYGLGYSCVAEWFMNYGWFGCLFAGFYAYLITMFECVSYKNILRGRYLVPAALLTFLATQIFYARSSMFYALFDVRFGFWIIVIYKLVHYRNNYGYKAY